MNHKKSDICLKFGESLKKKRLEKKISQELLGDISNLHRTYISDIERGERNASLETIGKLAQALNIEPKELFDFEIQHHEEEQ